MNCTILHNMTILLSVLYFARTYRKRFEIRFKVLAVGVGPETNAYLLFFSSFFFLRKYNTGEGHFRTRHSGEGRCDGGSNDCNCALVRNVFVDCIYYVRNEKKTKKKRKHRCYYCTAARRRQPVKLARRARVPPASILLYYCRSSHETL